MSTLEYKWWCRRYTKQLILQRALRRELKRADLTPGERLEIDEMLASLTTQIERRKRDMDAVLNRPPCEYCGRTTSERDQVDELNGRTLCRDSQTCARLAAKARQGKAAE